MKEIFSVKTSVIYEIRDDEIKLNLSWCKEDEKYKLTKYLSAAFFGGVSLRSSKQDTRRKINSASTKQSE